MMFFFEPQKKSFVEASLRWLLYLEINQPALRPFGPAEGVVEEQVQGRETAQALQGLLSSSHLHKTALRGRNSGGTTAVGASHRHGDAQDLAQRGVLPKQVQFCHPEPNLQSRGRKLSK